MLITAFKHKEYMSKPKNNNHIKDLILLFSIPIGIALFAAAAIYLPRLMANPKHDMIYSLCDSYRCTNSYSTDANGKIVRTDTDENSKYYDAASLYYYDAANDSTRILSIEEANKYSLNTSSKSPDGYALVQENSSSGFLFWSDSDDDWYLKVGAKKKKVQLTNTGSNSSSEIKFLGWIK